MRWFAAIVLVFAAELAVAGFDGNSTFGGKFSRGRFTVPSDSTPPLISGLSNDSTPRQSKSWTWGCNETPCTYRFAVDTSASWTPTGSFVSTTTTSQSSGTATYYLHVQARDAAGNVTTVTTVSAVLDNTPALITGLSNDSTPRQSKSWTWSCSEAPCTYRTLIDTSAATTPVAAPTSDTAATQASGNATYYLHIIAIDAAGNASAAEHYSAVLDNTGPSVTGLSNDSTATASKTWNWGCSETCTYRFAVDTSASWTPTGTYAATATATQSTGTATYYLHVEARDVAGNLSAVTTVSAVLDQAVFRFASSTFAGQSCPTLTGTKGEAMTFTRTGNETCMNGDGTLRDVANNCPCVTDLGVQRFAGVTNIVNNSITLGSWQLNNVTLLASNTNEVTDPRGGNDAEKIRFFASVSGGAESRIALGPNTGQTNGSIYSTSIYARCASASSCTLWSWLSEDHLTGGPTPCTFTNTGWTRCIRTQAAGGTATLWFSFGTATWAAGVNVPQQDVYLYEANYVAGAIPGPPITTTSGSVARSSSSLVTANPFASRMPSAWCIREALRASGAWRTGDPTYISRGLFAFAGMNAANSARAVISGGSNKLQWWTYDSTSTSKFIEYNYSALGPPADSSLHAVTACMSAGGAPTLTWDGATISSAGGSGAGTGIWSAAGGNLELGYETGGTHFNGWIESACLDLGSGAC